MANTEKIIQRAVGLPEAFTDALRSPRITIATTGPSTASKIDQRIMRGKERRSTNQASVNENRIAAGKVTNQTVAAASNVLPNNESMWFEDSKTANA